MATSRFKEDEGVPAGDSIRDTENNSVKVVIYTPISLFTPHPLHW